MKKNKKIAIIGSYPPPYGGISVHIQRMLAHLDKRDFVFFNTAKSTYPASLPFWGWHKIFRSFLFLFKRYKLIHFHSPDHLARILLCLVGYVKKNIYLHIHGESLEQALNHGSLSSHILKRCLRNVHILASNTHIVQVVKPYHPRSIHEIDAFLPPVFNQEIFEKISRLIPTVESGLTISMVGWFRTYLKTDVYGFDIALEALHFLRNEHHLNAVIIASVNGINDPDLFQKFNKRRSELGLEKSFLFIMEDLEEVWPLYLKSDIFIRPTNTDGGSVSIKEALWFEARVIGSDAVPRPEGVTLFKNRDARDLAEKIRHLAEMKFESVDKRIKISRLKKYRSKLIGEIYQIEK